jgi:hypothetical protein
VIVDNFRESTDRCSRAHLDALGGFDRGAGFDEDRVPEPNFSPVMRAKLDWCAPPAQSNPPSEVHSTGARDAHPAFDLDLWTKLDAKYRRQRSQSR